MCNVGIIKVARLLFSDLRDKGIRPDVVAYNVIISGLVKRGQTSEALELFRKMEAKGSSQTAALITVSSKDFIGTVIHQVVFSL